jgi:hypothetical protein
MPCHAMPMPRCAVALRSRFQNGMVVAWHGRGMACVHQTRPYCVNQMGKTQSKPLAAPHGRGKAWARHGMCELALRVSRYSFYPGSVYTLKLNTNMQYDPVTTKLNVPPFVMPASNNFKECRDATPNVYRHWRVQKAKLLLRHCLAVLWAPTKLHCSRVL